MTVSISHAVSKNPKEYTMIIVGYANTLKPHLQAEMQDAVIVDVNHIEKSTDRRSNRLGLAIAVQYAATGQPVILTSFESAETLHKDEIFTSLMKKMNVRFLRLPASLNDYRRVYRGFKSARRCKGHGKECHNEAIRGYKGLCSDCFEEYCNDSESEIRDAAEDNYFNPEIPEEDWERPWENLDE